MAAALKAEGPATRGRLREVTGLSRPTIAAAIMELDQRGLIAIGDMGSSISGQPFGRPAEVIRLDRRAGLIVGIEVGRRHVKVALADLGHQQIDKMPGQEAERDVYLHSRDDDTRPVDAIAVVAELVRGLLDSNGSSLSEVVGIGLGIRAPVTRKGVVGSSSLLPKWAGFEPGSALAGHLDGVTVLVENDASLGALGEWAFGMRERREVTDGHELTYVKIGSGIGAGMVRNGRMHRGADGTAGELGHITLNYLERMPCACGSHGCLEYYASGSKLLERARTVWPDLNDITGLVSRARDGDRFCTALIEDAGDLIGIALGTLVNLNSPNDILVGGALSAAGEILLAPIRDKIQRTAMPPAAGAAHVGLARLERWSTACGAAALALRADLPDSS